MIITGKLLIKPIYADDISYITSSKEETVEIIQTELPKMLKDGNLELNNTKTVLYEIPKPLIIINKNDIPMWSDLDWLINQNRRIKHQFGITASYWDFT